MAQLTWLKQSTATTLLVGPFLDETDGKTAETALTLSQADFLLWKEGGTTLAQKNESTSATHRNIGYYTCPINTTDTNTLGVLSVCVHESGALPVRQDYLVVPANVYDSVVLGTDLLQTDGREVNGSTTAAARLALSAAQMIPGTSDNTGFTATTTVMEASDITEATADHYNGRIIIFTSGALIGQATRIEDYALNGGRGRFTMTALTEVVPNGTTFLIV
jgi:hypothetical protein